MKEPTVMSRRRRTTAILLLLILVLSMCVMPLSARESGSKWDDWNFTTYAEEDFNIGDDDDDSFNITNEFTLITKWIYLILSNIL